MESIERRQKIERRRIKGMHPAGFKSITQRIMKRVLYHRPTTAAPERRADMHVGGETRE